MYLNIRPHHGLCIRFFEGKGYSNAFTVHMAKVIEDLIENPKVCLVLKEDEICSACPNCRTAGCETRDKVLAYDAAVLRLCNLEEEEVLDFRQFWDSITENIIEANKLSEICGDCEWAQICRSSMERNG